MIVLSAHSTKPEYVSSPFWGSICPWYTCTVTSETLATSKLAIYHVTEPAYQGLTYDVQV